MKRIPWVVKRRIKRKYRLRRNVEIVMRQVEEIFMEEEWDYVGDEKLTENEKFIKYMGQGLN